MVRCYAESRKHHEQRADHLALHNLILEEGHDFIYDQLRKKMENGYKLLKEEKTKFEKAKMV